METIYYLVTTLFTMFIYCNCIKIFFLPTKYLST